MLPINKKLALGVQRMTKLGIYLLMYILIKLTCDLVSLSWMLVSSEGRYSTKNPGWRDVVSFSEMLDSETDGEQTPSSWSPPVTFLLLLSWRQINSHALSRSAELGTLLFLLDLTKITAPLSLEQSALPCFVLPRGGTQSSRRILPDWKGKWGQKSFQHNLHFNFFSCSTGTEVHKVRHIRTKIVCHASLVGSSCPVLK